MNMRMRKRPKTRIKPVSAEDTYPTVMREADPQSLPSHWDARSPAEQRENAALVSQATYQRWSTDTSVDALESIPESALTPRELAMRVTVDGMRSDSESIRVASVKNLVSMERQNQTDSLPRPESGTQHLHLHDLAELDPAAVIARKLEQSRQAVRERQRRAALRRIR